MTLNKYMSLGLSLLLCALLLGCDSKPVQENNGVVTTKVMRASLSKALHFTGTILPMQENSLISPFEAVIESTPIHYGEALKKNAVVFQLRSTDLQKQYNDILTEYLKAKDNFNISQSKFQGAQELWASGLMSKNAYSSEKSNLDNARIVLLQSQQKFSELLSKMGKQPDHWTKLTLSEFDKVREALSGNHQKIEIRSPSDGILLYPPKSGEEQNQRPRVGSAVKVGQVLGLIGDLSGVRVNIDVPEIDIDKIHRGMKAKIRGVALGEEILEGELVAVNGQASSGGGSSLPVFSAVVVVSHLNEQQKKRVRVGMSATIELSLEAYPQLVIPIASVQPKNGASVVTVRNKNHQLEDRTIRTGGASLDKVAVLDGLQEGEEVVVYGPRAFN